MCSASAPASAPAWTPARRTCAFTPLTADTATLYLDTSGEALFKRGWRRNPEAPLRENLAAGILRLSGWQPGEPCSTRCAAAARFWWKPPTWR